ncbi:hypothetical protein MKX08_010157 [Trichoderma sp. CBMAI-0020]|nr:hypothetical protein MKX08_010157 [Trichoderma sp. CBMAI-0020]
MASPVARGAATSIPPPNAGPNAASPTNGLGGGSLNGHGDGGAEKDSSSMDILPHDTPTPSLNILPDPSSAPTPSSPGILPPSSTTVVSFNNTDAFGPDLTNRVFDTSTRAKTFLWTYDASHTNLVNISWYGANITGKPFNVSQATVIASAEFDGSTSPEFMKQKMKEEKKNITPLANKDLPVSDSNAVLNLTAPKVIPWYEKEMVVKISWTGQDEEQGFSQSGVFTVARRDDRSFSVEDFTRNVTKAEQDRQGFESITSQGTPGSSGSSSKSSGGGLSTGAIVGIAVACAVVGIALLAGLVWFLLRRRRRRSVGEGYKATRQTTNSFTAKEARPSVAESPIIVSPFSDDGEARGFSNSNIAIALPQRSSTPRAVPAINDEGSRDRPDSAASGNRSRGGIAHLVEEGMTEADILRLEEEERHLDVEIERAARRGSS